MRHYRLASLLTLTALLAGCGGGSSPQASTPLMQSDGCLTMDGKVFCQASPTPAATATPLPAPVLVPSALPTVLLQGTPQPIASTAAAATPTPVATPTPGVGNQVEPFSDGLVLTMTQAQLASQFGAPASDDGAGDLTYPDFTVMVQHGKIAALHLTGPNAKLHNGIGVGSSKADVQNAFGGYDSVDYNQYQLRFSYTLATVSQIAIYAANGSFAPYAPDPSDSYPAIDMTQLAGTWLDAGASPAPGASSTTATPDKLVIESSGSYALTIAGGAPQFANCNPAGKFLVFLGLSDQNDWNDGVAHLDANGHLVFGANGPVFTQQPGP